MTKQGAEMRTEIEIAEENACVYHHVAEALQVRDLLRAFRALGLMTKINREDQATMDFLENLDVELKDLSKYYKSRSENRFNRFSYLKGVKSEK